MTKYDVRTTYQDRFNHSSIELLHLLDNIQVGYPSFGSERSAHRWHDRCHIPYHLSHPLNWQISELNSTLNRCDRNLLASNDPYPGNTLFPSAELFLNQACRYGHFLIFRANVFDRGFNFQFSRSNSSWNHSRFWGREKQTILQIATWTHHISYVRNLTNLWMGNGSSTQSRTFS